MNGFKFDFHNTYPASTSLNLHTDLIQLKCMLCEPACKAPMPQHVTVCEQLQELSHPPPSTR